MERRVRSFFAGRDVPRGTSEDALPRRAYLHESREHSSLVMSHVEPHEGAFHRRAHALRATWKVACARSSPAVMSTWNVTKMRSHVELIPPIYTESREHSSLVMSHVECHEGAFHRRAHPCELDGKARALVLRQPVISHIERHEGAFQRRTHSCELHGGSLSRSSPAVPFGRYASTYSSAGRACRSPTWNVTEGASNVERSSPEPDVPRGTSGIPYGATWKVASARFSPARDAPRGTARRCVHVALELGTFHVER
jgi:hypothetical protein